jgi:hypothetical protein
MLQERAKLIELLIQLNIAVLWDVALGSVLGIIVSEEPAASMFRLEVDAPGFSKRFASAYHTSWSYIPEDSNIHCQYL